MMIKIYSNKTELLQFIVMWCIILIVLLFIDKVAVVVAILYSLFLLFTSYQDYKIEFKHNCIVFYRFFSSNEVTIENIEKIVIEAPFKYGKLFDQAQHAYIHCLDNKVITFNIYNLDRKSLINEFLHLANDSGFEFINNTTK